MSEIDEPTLRDLFTSTADKASAPPALEVRIRALMTEQPYAVLCTQGGGQPYGSLIAFAVNPTLNGVVFATPIATRKYRLLSECDRVALVIDNRAGHPGDISKIDAVTATGKAVTLNHDGAADEWRDRLIHKHPHMRNFICAPSTALVRVDILRYLHVVRLQEVHQWVPPRPV